MVKKLKYLISIILFITILFVTQSAVKAVETFTTSDGIVATKIVEGTDGTIDFKITNINLSEEVEYTWAIATTTNVAEVKDWYKLADVNAANKSAMLSITSSSTKMKSILRTTNTAWLYVKDTKNNTYPVNALKVDLTLPPLKVPITDIRGSVMGDWQVNIPYQIGKCYYQYQKITDSTIIEQYISSKGDLNKLKLATLSQAPQTGWNNVESLGYVPSKSTPTEEGLYYLWVKGKDADSKTVIGYTVFSVDISAPTVKSIEVTSPKDGTYKTSQTVKIRVNFSETITGTSVPALVIKFGESSERKITNGTIKSNYIEYSYNIQESDKGQLATVSLSGGEIKDTDGNLAKLSCPIISGYTIKANMEGITNNNTDNQDKTNNTQTGNNNTNGNSSNSSTTNNSKNNANDVTVANNKLPAAGAGLKVISLIVIILGGSTFAYLQYNKLKEI